MTQILAAIIWAVTLIAWLAIRIPRRRKASKTKVVEDRVSTVEKVTLLLCILGFFVIPTLHVATNLFEFADHAFSSTRAWIGLAVAVSFVVLFYLSHKQLARNWSVTLELREDHKLVDHGLYSQIRHPMYTSFWLWGISQWLLLPNWIAGPAGLISIAILYFSRIKHEEAMMRSQFGRQYDEYCQRTKRLIPKIY